jgi:hypothetical protein
VLWPFVSVMKSLIEYRKFRTQAERQYGRHKDDPEAYIGTREQNARTRTDHALFPPQISRSDTSLPSSEQEKSLELPGRGLEKADSSSSEDLPTSYEKAPEAQDDPKARSNHPGGHLNLRTSGHHDTESHEHATALSKISTQSSHSSDDVALGLILTGIQVRTRETSEGGEELVFVVHYKDDSDSMNPQNWSSFCKISATFLIGCIGFVVTVASSIDSTVSKRAAEEFGVSKVTESLATGLYLIGFGVGALIAGPCSEALGRNL